MLVDWLVRWQEVDEHKIEVAGVTFGSFFATVMVAHEPHIAATAAMSTCLEPGCYSIF